MFLRCSENDPKYKMLYIFVLNKAKYTNFVPIFFIFNLFQKMLGGHFVFKKSNVGWVISTLDCFPSFPAFQFGKLPLGLQCALHLGHTITKVVLCLYPYPYHDPYCHFLMCQQGNFVNVRLFIFCKTFVFESLIDRFFIRGKYNQHQAKLI